MSIHMGQYTTRKHKFLQPPTESEDMRDVNLLRYVLVAFWGLRQRKPVTVRDVRLAFCISFRQASDILEYMTERGSAIVEAECRLRHPERMRREWLVTAVYGERLRYSREPGNRNSVLPEGNCVPGRDGISELRRWFTGWRPGRKVPEDLLESE
ncbi:CaiF/GrlA family transcriptional regulator [Citrobacter amalonaticus]|uniref:CaiF/GrlA family transcriptional regulator n=1 Tax=Citrobacter amalonaticus TaxID=35703 RepID=UPI001A2555F3|nr:CaiF/GrlA family transcriptional regulator [Citrobacter amalonaticus]HDQ2813318.1 CaiF/GrlA family transcriptional regulator [Citrobacter amalonaticus]